MGNLRSNMTELEWDDIQKEIKREKELGKPESTIIYFSVFNKSIKDLQEMKKSLKKFYSKYELLELDKHIKWLKLNNGKY